MTLLGALAGHEVAIVADPPMLVFDQPDAASSRRRRPTSSGSAPATLSGREGALVGAAGRRHFAGGVAPRGGPRPRLADGGTVAPSRSATSSASR